MQEGEGAEDVDDISGAGFAADFFDGIADADFRAVAVGCDAVTTVGDFVTDLGGHDHATVAILVEDAEGLAVDFGDAGDGGRTRLRVSDCLIAVKERETYSS